MIKKYLKKSNLINNERASSLNRTNSLNRTSSFRKSNIEINKNSNYNRVLFKIRKNYKINKRDLLTEHEKLIQLYQSDMAHQEMVLKAGGGIENMIEVLDNQNTDIELMKQKIFRLMRENILMEQKIVNLVTTYKFKHCGILLEINKQKVLDSFKNSIILRKCKFLKKSIINTSFLINEKLKNFLDFIILNINILYNLRYFVYFLNLLFLINNVRNHVQII